jgi:hypothetical protein
MSVVGREKTKWARNPTQREVMKYEYAVHREKWPMSP